MTTKTIGLCLFAALLGVFAGCEQPDAQEEERRECQDFIAAVEGCVVATWSPPYEPYEPGGETHSQDVKDCMFSCDDNGRLPSRPIFQNSDGHWDPCIDLPTNDTIDEWRNALRGDCELFAYQWKDSCGEELGDGAYDVLIDACYRHSFDFLAFFPLCVQGRPHSSALELEMNECE